MGVRPFVALTNDHVRAGEEQKAPASRLACMPTRKEQAAHELRRMMKWIALAGVLMTIGALVYLYLMGAWGTHAVIATIFGVFISVLLGCGLFALAFFSDKSGHDDDVRSTTTKRDDP